jgi:hypothetical protein
MIAYEERLKQDTYWALEEGSMHFERNSEVQKTLSRFARRLEELTIPYAVIGDLALFFHGYRRFTVVVEILVTREGLQTIHQQPSAVEPAGLCPAVTKQPASAGRRVGGADQPPPDR